MILPVECHVLVSFGKSGFMLKIFRDTKIL